MPVARFKGVFCCSSEDKVEISLFMHIFIEIISYFAFNRTSQHQIC